MTTTVQHYLDKGPFTSSGKVSTPCSKRSSSVAMRFTSQLSGSRLLNAVRMHDQQGEPWSEASFQAFLQVNGY
jgi:hypothetical protein